MKNLKLFLEQVDVKARSRISKDLKAAGYKKVGSGVDAIVWAKNDSEVLKIVVPDFQNTSGSGFQKDFDRAVRTVRKFYEFCKKQNSIHLPRFTKFVTSELEEFELDGELVLLVSMERLKPIKSGSDEECFYWLLVELNHLYSTATETYGVLMNSKHVVQNKIDFDEYVLRGYAHLEKLKDTTWILDFLRVMKAAEEFGDSQEFSWDLHTENIMLRGKVPVIIDPWMNLT